MMHFPKEEMYFFWNHSTIESYLLGFMPLRYNFYKQISENIYLQPYCWHICSYFLSVTIIIIGTLKTNICNPLDISAACTLVTGTTVASVFVLHFYKGKSKNKYL